MSKKRAFTMVELIFVIVILGILAAVAIPRLNASREDAEIAKFIANLNTALRDIQSFYAANGELYNDDIAIKHPKLKQHSDLTKLTNVDLTKIGGNYRLLLGGKNCIELFARHNDNGIETYCLKTIKSAYDANESCQKALEKEEVKRLFSGYKDHTALDNVTHNAVDAIKDDGAVNAFACYRPGESNVEW